MDHGDDSRDSLSGSESSGNDTVADQERRDLLTGLGRFAYAAPALALLTQPKLAQADYGGARGGTRDGSRSKTPDRG